MALHHFVILGTDGFVDHEQLQNFLAEHGWRVLSANFFDDVHLGDEPQAATPLETIIGHDTPLTQALGAEGIHCLEDIRRFRVQHVLEVWRDAPRGMNNSSVFVVLKKRAASFQLLIDSLRAAGLSFPDWDLRYAVPLRELHLSTRSHNALLREGISEVGVLAGLSDKFLLDIRNFGKVSLREVHDKLAQHQEMLCV